MNILAAVKASRSGNSGVNVLNVSIKSGKRICRVWRYFCQPLILVDSR
jgi:hypothetical protein